MKNGDFLIIYAAGYLEDSGPDNYFILGSSTTAFNEQPEIELSPSSLPSGVSRRCHSCPPTSRENETFYLQESPLLKLTNVQSHYIR